MFTKDVNFNVSSRFFRPTLLNACKAFYDPFYYPDINLDSLKDITFETIETCFKNSDDCKVLTKYPPEISGIMNYIFFSYKSFTALCTTNSDLFKRISFPYYDKISNQLCQKLKEEFSNLSIIDLYTDSLLTDERSYPLQHMNILFYGEKLLSFKMSAGGFSTYQSSGSLKFLKKILKSHNLIDFETNILKKNIPDTNTKFSIPVCSLFSLTFVLLAFKEQDIPLEYQYMILSDFVINVCISNKCKPYEILMYLINVKDSFTKSAFIDSWKNFTCSFQEKFYNRLIPDNTTIVPGDDVDLFLEFSREHLKLIEYYKEIKMKMDIFRKIEKAILLEETKKSTPDDTEAEDAIESYKNIFLKLFHYEENGYIPISSDRLFDFIKNDFSNNVYFWNLMNSLESVYSLDNDLLELHPIHSEFFFNHLR